MLQQGLQATAQKTEVLAKLSWILCPVLPTDQTASAKKTPEMAGLHARPSSASPIQLGVKKTGELCL